MPSPQIAKGLWNRGKLVIQRRYHLSRKRFYGSNMTSDEIKILREFKELEGRANAEILCKRTPFSIRYIQHLLRNLHEARYLKVDTLARYPMYQLTRPVKRRLKL